MPGESLDSATSGGAGVSAPPLSEAEVRNSAPRDSGRPPLPLKRAATPPVLRRAVGGILAFGFGLLVFFLSLELVQTINLLLEWPIYTGWPVLALLLGAMGYGIFRLARVLISIREMPIVSRLEPGELETLPGKRKEEIRHQLLGQLEYLRKQRKDPEDPLHPVLDRLVAESTSHPAGEWVRDYDRHVLTRLGREARDRVRKIALTAGASAALSPWRILDAIIAFNAATQAAYDVLRIHGIRPSQAVAVAFAFDTFLNTFLATMVEDVSSDLVDSLTAQISAETGASAAKVLAPKIAEGLTT
ncbi:MAG: DUF697 domain-containing protein, partial [Puniceicoccales bacterium]